MDTMQLPINNGLPWQRDQLILAFDLYCRIPFKKTKANNPQVKNLALILGRTPASIARKLGNFGAFDPQLRKLSISGLSHGSRLDYEIWQEFHRDWGKLAVEADHLKAQLGLKEQPDFVEQFKYPQGPSEGMATTKQRLHQSFFRRAVLASYESTCCITGLAIPECLMASHIIPWSKDEKRRADPTNGLCLSATFDKLFDRGLITIADSYRLRVSSKIKSLKNNEAQAQICGREGQKLILPTRFLPDIECLRWHTVHIFQSS
jgi:predicted restriction endonuclease